MHGLFQRFCFLILAGFLIGQTAVAAEPGVRDMPGAMHANSFDIGYIADDDALVADLVTTDEDSAPVEDARETAIGMRFANGWSLGLTYDSIDTGLSIGSTVLAESIGPLYEGPMFVATLRFR